MSLPQVDRLSRLPQLAPDGACLLDEYLRLPDAWRWCGGVPDRLPDVLADAVDRYPGAATPPRGDVVLARSDGALVGQVLLVPHDPDSARIERLYVIPSWRERGVGQGLVDAVAALGRELGYRNLVLDVMTTRAAACRLYERNGFTPVPPWASFHVPMTFLRRALESGSPSPGC